MLPPKLTLKTENSDIIEMCRAYWEVDDEGKFTWTVKFLADKFGFKQTEFRDLVIEKCDAESQDTACSECDTPYIFTSRSDFTARSRTPAEWLCPICTTEKKRKAVEQAARLEANQREVIRRMFDASKSNSFDVKEMSLKDAVYFLALVRMNGTEDFEQILPIMQAPRPLTVFDQNKYEVLKSLYHRNYIIVHGDSSPESVTLENGQVKHFYLGQVTYAVAGPTRNDRKNIVLTLEEIFRSQSWPDHWYSEQLELWKQFVLDEAIAYMTVVLKEHGFTFEPGEKTIAMLKALFEDYSLGQVYNLIWRAAKDAASRYLRERIPKKHATNHAISSVRHQGERAKAEGWDVKPFRRDFRCPEPISSEIFFNAVLQIGSDGFNLKPYECVFPM